jgi:phospho-N-acetylmuramoyl-pentapeptide-transferase
MLYVFLTEVLGKVDGLGFMRVFGYTSTRILSAAITSLLLSMILGPWFIGRLRSRQIGQQIRDDGPATHKKKAGTPTMGGSLILLSLVTSTLLWCDLDNEFVWLTLVVTVTFGIIGFLDDYFKVARKNTKGVSGKVRLAAEFAIAGACMGYLFYSDMMQPDVRLALQLPFTNFYDDPWYLEPWLYAVLASFVVVGCANAVNLTDGLDGLAIGPSIINAGTFMIFAYIAGVSTTIAITVDGHLTSINIAEYLHIAHINGVAELAIFCAAMFGAGMGFLWFNAYPAEVFMGDVGALSLGGAIGMLAVLTKNELVLLLVGGVFVMETLSVIIQVGSYKMRGGKRVFLMAPIHHHFELKGWAEPKIIVRFWLISILLALMALGTIKLR